MQLTLQTDISLRILILMGGQGLDRRYTITELADFFHVSRNHMVKIVNKLGKESYLLNVRGKGGGIYLAKKPKDINIAEVIRTMENNTEIIDCQKHQCIFTGNCKLKGIINQASVLFFEHISQYTLADILIDL